MLKEIDRLLIILGNGLLSRYKYDLDFRYEQFDVLTILYKQKQQIKTDISDILYN